MLSHIWRIFSSSFFFFSSSFSFSVPPPLLCQIAQNSSKFYQFIPNSAKFCSFLWNTTKFCQTLPIFAHFYQIWPSLPSSWEEEEEIIPHMCESIGHRPLWGRCPAPSLSLNHNLLGQGTGTADHLTLLRLLYLNWQFCPSKLQISTVKPLINPLKYQFYALWYQISPFQRPTDWLTDYNRWTDIHITTLKQM